MLYAAKCYRPGITETELEQAAARAADPLPEPGDRAVTYRGSLRLTDDDLVLCPFEAPSPMAVKHANERAGIPCERVMDSVWLQPDPATASGARR
jgi:hypothetical protein